MKFDIYTFNSLDGLDLCNYLDHPLASSSLSIERDDIEALSQNLEHYTDDYHVVYALSILAITCPEIILTKLPDYLLSRSDAISSAAARILIHLPRKDINYSILDRVQQIHESNPACFVAGHVLHSIKENRR